MLREVVADTLERLADSDERLRMVTVTAVDTSADLRHAVVYLSSLTDESAAALAAERAQLQRAIGREVRLKRTPQLSFAADPAVAHGTHVEDLLRHLHEHDVSGDEGASVSGDEAADSSGHGASPSDDDA